MKNYIECKNCLVPTENSPVNCPVCGTNYNDGTGKRIHVSEEAREVIYDWGGIYVEPIIIEGTTDYLVWCESGVLRINSEGEILWKKFLATVSNLEINRDHFSVHGRNFDIESGESI